MVHRDKYTLSKIPYSFANFISFLFSPKSQLQISNGNFRICVCHHLTSLPFLSLFQNVCRECALPTGSTSTPKPLSAIQTLTQYALLSTLGSDILTYFSWQKIAVTAYLYQCKLCLLFVSYTKFLENANDVIQQKIKQLLLNKWKQERSLLFTHSDIFLESPTFKQFTSHINA